MNLVMVAIRDEKAEAWLNPMFFLSEGQAIRSFADAVNSGEGDIGKHPEDFNLFRVGYFDQKSGMIDVTEPYHLGLGSIYKTGYLKKEK